MTVSTSGSGTAVVGVVLCATRREIAPFAGIRTGQVTVAASNSPLHVSVHSFLLLAVLLCVGGNRSFKMCYSRTNAC